MKTEATVDTNNVAPPAAPAPSGVTQLTNDEITAVGGGFLIVLPGVLLITLAIVYLQS